ncbi:MAG: hypothetical protein U1F50_03955 [Rubrivivax sp.]
MPAPALERLRQLLDACAPGTALTPTLGLAAAAQARELAAELGRREDEMLAALRECGHLFRLGQLAEAVDLCQALRRAAAAAGLGAPLQAEQREMLRVLVLAACELARFDIAMEAAQELARLCAPLAEPGPRLMAAYALAACLERMGDSWQAMDVLEGALAADPPVPSRERLIANSGLAAVAIGMFHRLRGIEDGSAVLARARAAAEQAQAQLGAAEPAARITVIGNLGEILLHQGELAASRRLLDESLALAQQAELRAYEWRITATLADWHLAAAETAQALHQAEGLLAEMGSAAPLQTAIRAHDTACRACRQLGHDRRALTHLEAFERLERRRTVQQLRAQSQLAAARAQMPRAG